MSKHTLSHADQILAGEGVAFNAQDATHGMGGEDIPDTVRGIRIATLVAEVLQGGDTDTQAFATTQTPAAGGEQDLTLDGAETVDGVGSFNVCSRITITAAANETARTFTVLGRDANGRPQAEEIAGPNATTANGNKHFTKIDRIIVDDDTAGAVSAGQSEDLSRGLRRRALNWDVDFTTLSRVNIAWDNGGARETAGTYSPGNFTTPSAVSIDQRATYLPVDRTGDSEVVYLADLSKAGLGENYTDSRQRVPSAI